MEEVEWKVQSDREGVLNVRFRPSHIREAASFYLIVQSCILFAQAMLEVNNNCETS